MNLKEQIRRIIGMWSSDIDQGFYDEPTEAILKAVQEYLKENLVETEVDDYVQGGNAAIKALIEDLGESA